jgi:hypothetical protein
MDEDVDKNNAASIPTSVQTGHDKACKQKLNSSHAMWTVLTPVICGSGAQACNKLQCVNGCFLTGTNVSQTFKQHFKLINGRYECSKRSAATAGAVHRCSGLFLGCSVIYTLAERHCGTIWTPDFPCAVYVVISRVHLGASQRQLCCTVNIDAHASPTLLRKQFHSAFLLLSHGQCCK